MRPQILHTGNTEGKAITDRCANGATDRCTGSEHANRRHEDGYP